MEAVIIGMTSAAHVREEVAANLEVLLLLMFYGGRHLLYEAVIAVYFYPSVTQYPLEDGSVAGLLRRRRILVGFP
ncbi:regulator of intracellular pH; Na+/H+ antiporter [Salmonella enterica subsp. enterica]|uniref:Regulator of intracellular pH Na+/H+ antiporter n=1 Tax=Salmonella enterica I TaxID=59201 RepID=A0A379WSH2_SALET|nr:regulator of intracellular pH; Na+/H+ antiporter [Salmonella enterica subsp. enterica]